MSDVLLQDVRRRSTRAAAVSGVGALIIVAALIFAVVTIQQAETEVARLNAQRGSVSADIARLQGEIATLQKKKDQVTSDLAALSRATAASLGYSKQSKPTTTTLVNSVKAESLIQTRAASIATAGPAVTVTIYSKLFEQEVNQTVILPKLRKLGFNVRVQPARGQISHVPTNSVWFGSAVRIDDVKLLALALISAGVKLRSVKPFADADGAKRNMIDIGADAAVADKPPLALESITAAQSFERP